MTQGEPDFQNRAREQSFALFLRPIYHALAGYVRLRQTKVLASLPTMEVTMNGRQFILVWAIILGLSMLVWSGVGYVLGVL